MDEIVERGWKKGIDWKEAGERGGGEVSRPDQKRPNETPARRKVARFNFLGAHFANCDACGKNTKYEWPVGVPKYLIHSVWNF